MIVDPRAELTAEAVQQQNDVFDLYSYWPGDEDPDDDPEYVARARQIMGLPALESGG